MRTVLRGGILALRALLVAHTVLGFGAALLATLPLLPPNTFSCNGTRPPAISGRPGRHAVLRDGALVLCTLRGGRTLSFAPLRLPRRRIVVRGGAFPLSGTLLTPRAALGVTLLALDRTPPGRGRAFPCAAARPGRRAVVRGGVLTFSARMLSTPHTVRRAGTLSLAARLLLATQTTRRGRALSLAASVLLATQATRRGRALPVAARMLLATRAGWRGGALCCAGLRLCRDRSRVVTRLRGGRRGNLRRGSGFRAGGHARRGLRRAAGELIAA
ncbi:hypothetical protein, partial [Nocardia africana]